MALLLAFLLYLSQEETPPAPPPPPVPPPAEWLDSVHGGIRLLHRARWTGDDSDADLFNSLHVRAGRPDRDLFSASASGRLQSDLDGDRRSEGFSPFDSLSDSYKRSTTGRVHTAYLDVTNPWPGVRLRAGRQILEEFPESLPMDGGRGSVDVSKEAAISLFGGVPVNHFESSPDGDAMYGGWIEATLGPRSRARLEYLHLEDENTFGLFKDDLVGLSVEHGEGDWLLHGRATVLESEGRDILVRASTSDPEAGFTLDVRAYHLFEQQQALSYGLDSFAVFLLPVEPYTQLGVSASQELSERFGIDGAVSARQLEDGGDEGAYNHEFTRWSFTARSRDWPGAGLSLAATGDFWQTRDDDFWTAGGSAAWEVAESVKLDVSSSYTLFTIDALTGEERERVRLLSGGVRWTMNAETRLDARYTIEKNDVDTFHTADVGVRYAF